MKHRHGNRILGRTAEHRQALLKSLTSDLLRHGSIITTQARGKELRRFFEPLVTEAKKELTLHRRRLLLEQLLLPTDLARLQAVAQNNQTRPGGYVRLTKLPVTRNDAAQTVRIDILSGTAA